MSLYSWAGGSLCTVFNECYELLRISKIQRKGESDAEWAARRARAVEEVNQRLLVLLHAVVQVPYECPHAPVMSHSFGSQTSISLKCLFYAMRAVIVIPSARMDVGRRGIVSCMQIADV